MKRPTWATVVGILGIILGCLGLLGAAQITMMPRMMALQKEVWKGMQESMEKQEVPSAQQVPLERFFTEDFFKAFEEAVNQFEKIYDLPDWYGTWSVVAGVLAAVVSGFYLFASIRLLEIAPNAIKLFYSAAALSIALTLMRGVVALSTMSLMALGMFVGSIGGVVIHVVLVIVVATGNKEAFTSQRA